MAKPIERRWENWATASELAKSWGVTPRRVQQILVKLNEKNLIEIGVIVVEIGGLNPVSKPIYWRIQ